MKSLQMMKVALVGLVLVASCVKDPDVVNDDEMLISTEARFEKSSSAGNLIATAIVEENDLDFAFVPSELLADEGFALVNPEMDKDDIQSRILNLYGPGGTVYQVGTMRGSDIEKFLISRTVETLRHDLHVAGLTYDIKVKGGIPTITHIRHEDGSELEGSRYYRVAVEDTAYRGRFPGYYYRHNLSRAFREETQTVSARVSVLDYLSKVKSLKPFRKLRSQVEIIHGETVPGITPIAKVQGTSHMSDYHSKTVTVEGIITTIGADTEGEREDVLEAYVQSVEDDGNPLTSEALYVDLYRVSGASVLARGDLVQITGVVYEDLVNEGLTRTGLREIELVKVLKKNQSLPKPVVLGVDVKVPTDTISSYYGNLNHKPVLELTDGIDFWESLEGMRVKAPSPRVVGFAGGLKDYSESRRSKSYINVFIVADETVSQEQVTPKGGVIIDNVNSDYNPEIIRVIDHHLASDANKKPLVDSKFLYEVGDKFDFDVEGIIAYNVNLFGSGEFVMYVTDRFKGTRTQTQLKELSNKPKSKIFPVGDRLTVASFNVENLSGNDRVNTGKEFRFQNIGTSISQNLNCPDIVNLVEIQDNDGPIDEDPLSQDNADASVTLNRLIENINDCPLEVDYRPINIDPFENAEGGQPGGNIRVAMIYNAKRVTFNQRGEAGPGSETYLGKDGSLVLNPGRVFPYDIRLKGTRKPIAAEFEFNGEKVFVVGNHFNSKGGDTSLWAAAQPPTFGSEARRTQIADTVSEFCEQILRRDNDANVIVLGDFNDFNDSRALQSLEGSWLKNLANVLDENGNPLVHPNDQYTYNYGGNSQPLDFILVSDALQQKDPKLEIIHLNTDYMLQISDHDPIISSYDFGKE